VNSLDGEAYCIYSLDMDSGSDLTAAAFGVPGFGFLYSWPPAFIFSLGMMTRTTTYPFMIYISFLLDWEWMAVYWRSKLVRPLGCDRGVLSILESLG
jgi:hypothetical protein